jgi:hypothetical protein
MNIVEVLSNHEVKMIQTQEIIVNPTLNLVEQIVMLSNVLLAEIIHIVPLQSCYTSARINFMRIGNIFCGISPLAMLFYNLFTINSCENLSLARASYKNW